MLLLFTLVAFFRGLILLEEKLLIHTCLTHSLTQFSNHYVVPAMPVTIGGEENLELSTGQARMDNLHSFPCQIVRIRINDGLRTINKIRPVIFFLRVRLVV